MEKDDLKLALKCAIKLNVNKILADPTDPVYLKNLERVMAADEILDPIIPRPKSEALEISKDLIKLINDKVIDITYKNNQVDTDMSQIKNETTSLMHLRDMYLRAVN